MDLGGHRITALEQLILQKQANENMMINNLLHCH